jgi:L-aspartate oxidase
VQIHPTTFYSNEDRSFLISESVRGEGAVLRDKNGNRFTNELSPRDVLTKAIKEQMEKEQDMLLDKNPNIIEKFAKW